VKVALCPGTRDVVEPEHDPAGTLRDWQVGAEVKVPAGGVWVSAIPTELRVTFPVFLATNE
jgi:hypothetical protein